jgi:DNA-binding IscR family transcriptional regulator
MRTANRFAIAIHVLALLGTDLAGDKGSEWMAGSIGVNAVVVRNTISKLRRAGLVATRPGVPGATLAKPLSDISLLDVFRAVEDEGEVFGIHPRPHPACPVGGRIQGTLEVVFGEAQAAMEGRLRSTTMEQVLEVLKRRPMAASH